ncbi:hypothetical protein EG68_05672 [Paragonimus skrjabini miyazakii]|uniref:protein-serine/threonine phosphatase n=1 Tax=Paragonimus skrjabini miyazakii TaxID=59628 RepID=A0A8S9Z1Z8_9TREM|nr:hypothetical protein EG68_05672 [Paragonimus skrjabini miyazakii]
MNWPMLPARTNNKIIRRIPRLIARLLDHQVLKGIFADITEHEVMDMCLLMPELFLADTALIQLRTDSSLMVVGDIYGQYGHLVRLFNYYGHPPGQKYLFLGNYINQGPRSIETITLLFAYKLCYPEDIFLLRGKHECARLAKYYGFYDECMKRFSRRIWNSIVQVFSYMPSVAIVDDRILCVHSGISPLLSHFDIRGIKGLKKFIRKSIGLPGEFGSNRLMTHFIWSDPDESIETWEQNPAGLGYLYGHKAVEDFCNRFNIKQIIRSSEMLQTGFEFFRNPKLLTIFSAPDYRETYANDGGLVSLYRVFKEADTKGQVNVLSPIIRLRCRQTLRMNITMTTVPIELGQGVHLHADLTTKEKILF